ncbi:hypothetical protein [Hymenobacter terrestris]|uniref:Uncharacterized protein n=1 Tax=Hymenobacter terrestris TaxID=2748310 RepID=A0ABX2Q6K4_9BACT|nr:hypothetical protein [Hymenobacter terrestris]NVO86601.1 hypothetical protein [Hymenobacter terrestris]
MSQPETGVWGRLDACLHAGNLSGAIVEVETALDALPSTVFHALRGASFLAQCDELLAWVDAFYAHASRKGPVGALCLELNAFDANPDAWFLDGFAYEAGADGDWLANEELVAAAEPFLLRGLEAGHAAFARYAAADQPAGGPLEPSRDLAAALVELRAQELVANAHRAAQAQGRAWGRVPVAATAHDSDRVYESAGVGEPLALAALTAASLVALAPAARPASRGGTVPFCYKLTLPSDPKVIGVRNGIMQVEICDDAFLAAVRSAPFNETEGVFSDPAKALAITGLRVVPRAKLTDVLSFGPMLYGFPFLVKRKTLALLSAFHTRITHVFPVALNPDEHGLNAYSLVRFQRLDLDCIDYARSTFYTGSPLLGNYQQHRFSNHAAFGEAFNSFLALPEHLVLAPHVDRTLDLFYLGSGLYVSERLKKALEQEKTTGIKISAAMLPTVEG